MKAVVIISCLTAVSVAQFQQGPSAPLREVDHFQAIVQPHLPRDPNVLDATKQFLNKFAELKALADAAPDDPIPIQSQAFQTRQVAPPPQRFAPKPAVAPAPQRFTFRTAAAAAAPVAPVAPVAHRFAAPQPAPATPDFDVNSEISQLLARHQAANPTPAPPPAPTPAPRRQPVAQAPSRPAAFPTFSVQSNLGSHQHSSFSNPTQSFASPMSHGVTNQQGLVVNPLRFQGPLAHTLPAGVGGKVQQVGFTPEVAAARRALANARANVLQQQASLARPSHLF